MKRSLKRRLIAGCMTGTSIDSLDVALVSIIGGGLEIRVEVLDCATRSLGSLADRLRALAQQERVAAGEIAKIAREFGLLHLELLREISAGQKLDLVAVHGQTVFHKPPLSWQLINPAPIAYGLSVPVVFDLRAADLALDGQGAPITPIADFVLFRDATESRSVVNLGGFCNITHLPAAKTDSGLAQWAARISGGDVCVCNQLLDGLARRLLNQPMDTDGATASRGRVVDDLFMDFASQLAQHAAAARSLGTGDETMQLYYGQNKPEDVLRTAVAAIADTIAHSVKGDRILLAGGGANNRTLVEEIRTRAVVPVQPTDDYGVPIAYREAIAMAVLGALCQDRVPITLPQVTGVKEAPVAGCWIIP